MRGKNSAASRVAVVAVVVVVLAAAAVGGLFLTGVLTPVQEKRQVVIGLSLPLTNPVGIHAKYAAEMAVEEINSAGGVILNGTRYELVLVSEDTNEMDPLIPVDQGVTAFKRLIELHGAHVIVGGVRTDVVVAQSQLLSQYKVVFLDVESNQRIVEDLVQSDYENYKYYFHFFAGGRNSSAGPYIATIPVALRNAAQKDPNFPDVSKVALVAENALWTAGLAGRPAGNSTFFTRLKQQGFDLVFAELYPTTQSDFSSYLARIKQSGAGLIILLFSGPPGVAFVKQWAAYDWSPGKKPIVFGPGLLGGFSWFWDQTGGAAQGTIWWPATVKVPVTPKTVPFIEKFSQRFRETPNTAAFDTYDAIYVLKAALERANTWKADRLVPALEQTDYDGVIGKIQFSRRLHGLNLANHNLYWYFGQWQNGELVPVWSPDQPQEVRNMILP
ncbi:MAG: ABC transporter substrate-binding protein [Candidatus Caldarchaeum sp.]